MGLQFTLPHKSTHATGGSDALTAADIGAASLTNTPPANLAATAAVGNSTEAARADHVHALPTAADIGAAPAPVIAPEETLGDGNPQYSNLVRLGPYTVYRLRVTIPMERGVSFGSGQAGDFAQIICSGSSNASSTLSVGRSDGFGGAVLLAYLRPGQSCFFYNPTGQNTAWVPLQTNADWNLSIGPNSILNKPGNFGGANGTTQGTAGLVPQPAATDNTKFLKGDGTWATAGLGSGVDLADQLPQNLSAVAEVGVSQKAAREDHRHAYPTAEELGAITGDLLETGLASRLPLSLELDVSGLHPDTAINYGGAPGSWEGRYKFDGYTQDGRPIYFSEGSGVLRYFDSAWRLFVGGDEPDAEPVDVYRNESEAFDPSALDSTQWARKVPSDNQLGFVWVFHEISVDRIDPLLEKISASEKGDSNGVAPLNSDGVVDLEFIALGAGHVGASPLSQYLAISGSGAGDYGGTYIFTGNFESGRPIYSHASNATITLQYNVAEGGDSGYWAISDDGDEVRTNFSDAFDPAQISATSWRQGQVLQSISVTRIAAASIEAVVPKISGIQVSGFSYDQINGFYEESGMRGGKKRYVKNNGIEIFWQDGAPEDERWYIAGDLGDGPFGMGSDNTDHPWDVPWDSWYVDEDAPGVLGIPLVENTAGVPLRYAITQSSAISGPLTILNAPVYDNDAVRQADLNAALDGVGGAGVHLPEPKIVFTGSKTIEFLTGGFNHDPNENTIEVSAEKVRLNRSPAVIVQDFSQDFLENNQVFIEMLIHKKRNSRKEGENEPRIVKFKKTDFVVSVGGETKPWGSSFWNRTLQLGGVGRFYSNIVHTEDPEINKKGIRVYGLTNPLLNGFYAENGNSGYIKDGQYEIYLEVDGETRTWVLYDQLTGNFTVSRSNSEFPWEATDWEDEGINPENLVIEKSTLRPARYNHLPVPVTALNKKIDLSLCLNNHLKEIGVKYFDIDGSEKEINLIGPTKNSPKANWSIGRASNGDWRPRHPYSADYKSLYIAFRYIVWMPEMNEGRGQIISGPISKTIKVRNSAFPFYTNHYHSSIHGYPVCELNNEFEKTSFTCQFS